ncbi:hypothetical protein Aab01nite_64370 [Paractinoplanes abujensis]|uniref:Uncharacterized protein n=1 Tax=Paractinoplanes abujensis TaxID=882441 RepID=A0A7W7CQ34_9ACTN|nr:hypothetical protein [Actinoplanes abujensis]MBB4692652.1 hypothetical protein [Actinoplanes abujensis]GID22847.1 hypothetical protein Aab01nite_64370 [Actinoplanes abujensis]
MRLLLSGVLVAVLVSGCGTEPPRETPPPAPSALPSPSLGTLSFFTRGPLSAAPTTPAATTTPSATATRSTTSDGWEITVYYTAVERFHDDEPTDVTGCLQLDCAHGDDDLGSYPASFVQAVQDEGTGHTSAGKYLNWSYDIGYWLDTAPRSADGRRLTPFVSAAADPDVLPHGTRFTIATCGHQDDGSAPPASTCTALRNGSWLVTDEFTPGLGGSKHIDAYIGPETGPGFTDSAWYVSLTGVRLTLA